MSQATQGAPAPTGAPPTAAAVGTPAPAPAARPGRATAYAALGTTARTTSPARRRRRSRRRSTGCGSARSRCAWSSAPSPALQLALSWQANRTAAADTEQLIRVQGIKTNLLRADALATNAFLVGGLEPAEQRAAYDDAIDQTCAPITDAAEAQPADRAALNALSSAVLDYAGDMELARANNRQGLPVGGAYLRKASSELRSTPCRSSTSWSTPTPTRRRDAMGAHHPWLVFLPAVLAPWCCCGSPTAGSARRFHRRVNVGHRRSPSSPSASSAIVAALVVNGQQNQNDELHATARSRPWSTGSTARTAANDAKANESLRLIARGSGQAFEDAWVAAAAIVDQALPGADA